MASEKKTTDAFEAALKRELQSVSQANAQDCPAPEVLAAYYDRSLMRSERARVDAHLIACARCQSMMAAIARADDSEASSVHGETARGLFWITRLLAPVAVVGIVIAVAIGMRTRQQRAPEVVALASPVAELKQLADSAPVSPPPSAPEAPVMSAPEVANAPAAITHQAHHHKDHAADEPASNALDRVAPGGPEFLASRKAALPPAKPELHKMAKAEAPATDAEKSAASSLTELSTASQGGPAAPAQPPAPASGAMANSVSSEASAPAAVAITGIGGPATGASAPQVQKRMAETGSFVRNEGTAAGAGVSGTVSAMAMAPRMNQVSSPDGSVAWRFGASGIIMRSENSTAWMTLRSGVTNDLLAAAAPSNDVCWMVGKSATIVRTLDGGAHWQVVRAPSSDDYTLVSASDSNNAIVGSTNGQRFATHDGGVTWSSP